MRHGSHDKTPVPCDFGDAGANFQSRVKASFLRSIGDEFDRSKHAYAAHFANNRKLRKGIFETALKVTSDIAGLSGEIFIFHAVQDSVRGRSSDRMPRIGVAVRKRSNAIGRIFHHLIDFLSDKSS